MWRFNKELRLVRDVRGHALIRHLFHFGFGGRLGGCSRFGLWLDHRSRTSARRFQVVRSLELPDGVNADAIKANLSNGVLKVTVPKPAPAQVKKVEVKAAA